MLGCVKFWWCKNEFVYVWEVIYGGEGKRVNFNVEGGYVFFFEFIG